MNQASVHLLTLCVPARTERIPCLLDRHSAMILALLLAVGVPAAATDDLRGLQDDPHLVDPTGLCTGTVVDPFIQNPNGQATGRKIVRLSNGDFVVAALAPRHGFHPSPNGMWNIGLVRYRLPCNHVPWGAGPYTVPATGAWANRYVVYPNVDAPQFVAIHDIQVFDNHIYVLADRRQTTVATSPRDVVVLVFTLGGALVGQYGALNSSLDERGAGMAFFSDHQLVPTTKLFIAATTFNLPGSGALTPTLVRMTRAGNGSLTRDSNLGPNGNQIYVDFVTPDLFCLPAARPCQASSNAIVLTHLGSFFNRIYLVGGVRRNTTGDWDFWALSANYNGVLNSDFGIGGRVAVAFNRGGNLRDVATAGAVIGGLFNDSLYLTGEVAQQPVVDGNGGNRGIGVVKLTRSGTLDTSFGTNGRSVHGGCSSPPCQTFFNGGDAESFPRAMVLSGNRLLIAGRARRRDDCFLPTGCTAPHRSAAELSILTAGSGILVDHGKRIPDADLFDVLVEPSGRITTAGVHFGDGLPRALTAQFRADRLFGNGFQQP